MKKILGKSIEDYMSFCNTVTNNDWDSKWYEMKKNRWFSNLENIENMTGAGAVVPFCLPFYDNYFNLDYKENGNKIEITIKKDNKEEKMNIIVNEYTVEVKANGKKKVIQNAGKKSIQLPSLIKKYKELFDDNLASPIILKSRFGTRKGGQLALQRHHGFWTPKMCVMIMLKGLFKTENENNSYENRPNTIYSRCVYRLSVSDLIDEKVPQKFSGRKIIFNKQTGKLLLSDEEKQAYLEEEERKKAEKKRKKAAERRRKKRKTGEGIGVYTLRKRFTFTLRF